MSNTAEHPAGTVVIIPYAYWGPVNASFKLARALAETGHRVVYVVPPEFSGALRDHGFDVYVYDKPKMEKAGSLSARLTMVYRGTRLRDTLLDSYIEELLSTHRPDWAFVDSDNPRYAAVLKRKVKVVMYSTTIGNSRAVNIPPYFSAFIPRDDRISRLYVSFLWKTWFVRKWLLFLKYEVLSLGNFDNSLKRYYSRHQLDRRCLDLNRAWPVGFKDLPELLLYPGAFDFHGHARHRAKFYVGPWVDLHRPGNDSFDWARLGGRKFIICCSMGTMSTFYYPGIAGFYRLLIDVIRDMPDATLLLASGKCDLPLVKNDAGNVFITETLPLPAVLRRCHVLINHGGTNSVKEAILNGVPQLLLPLDGRTDQNGVAARCVFHGVAIRRNIRSVDPDTLRSDINTLLSDQAYHRRAAILKKTFQDSELSMKEIFHIIETIHNP